MNIFRQRSLWIWCAAVTAVVEAITVALRFGGRIEAKEFNQTAPLWLQIHHMFWSLPLFVAAAFFRRRPRVVSLLVGVGLGLIASDLAHHFIVLPIVAGNTGWHWP